MEGHRVKYGPCGVPASPAPSVCSCPGPDSDANTSFSSDAAAALGVSGGKFALLAARKTFSNPCTRRPSGIGHQLLGGATASSTAANSGGENALDDGSGDGDRDGGGLAEEDEGDLGAEDGEKLGDDEDDEKQPQHADLHKSSSVFGNTQNLPIASNDDAVKTCIARYA